MPIPAAHQTPLPRPAIVFQSLTGDNAPPLDITKIFERMLSEVYPNNTLPAGQTNSWTVKVGASSCSPVNISRTVGEEVLTFDLADAETAAGFIRAIAKRAPAPAT